MDQQPTDPNNPTPPSEPVAPASMWDPQPASPVTPPPAVDPQVPVPTFTPPILPDSSASSIPTTPNFGTSQNPNPTPVADLSSVPSWVPVNENSMGNTPPPEAMPTDLSNLMGGNPSPAQAEPAQPSVVVPPSGSEVNQVVTSGSKGFPKIILILGAVLILIAIGASAYFILGIGNSSNLPSSVPAEEQSLVSPPKQIVPSVIPAETGTGSATLGNLSGATLSATPVPATSSGSAIELLRSRITPTPVR